ncbi:MULTISPECIES: hypothetical protein [unclassified Staphylococcus]|uniref:hypothetical protein n=1 Tax=unclassified Staphylococcus TaxID=91994 RepID=UPI0021D11E08|nr:MULTISPECIES: hypothetical protein [unclassified Staphylococcus]UXR72520.1 hypothetical protein MUA88_04915 [Staphylococcus sp. IVB6240]UXR74825.1 hypothetical protein MUA48_05095 [Staphylococcus sp. IVB6238]UXR77158.1 hypothetical protein MUA74_05160 [Staphylococcus sp. IVB6233]UXR81282.1 hypothetical protein MUA65_04765 [Staphylococcus sp. IVB6218]
MALFKNDPFKSHEKTVKKANKIINNQNLNQTTEEISIDKYFKKRHMTEFSNEMLPIVTNLKNRQMYSNGTKWFNAFMHGGNDSGTVLTVSFLNDLVDQNYAILHELDQHNKNFKRIVEQNDEIIELLKVIAKK